MYTLLNRIGIKLFPRLQLKRSWDNGYWYKRLSGSPVWLEKRKSIQAEPFWAYWGVRERMKRRQTCALRYRSILQRSYPSRQQNYTHTPATAQNTLASTNTAAVARETCRKSRRIWYAPHCARNRRLINNYRNLITFRFKVRLNFWNTSFRF